MRVLILNDYGTLSGGAEYMSAALRDGLRRRGHEARLLTTTAAPLGVPNVADHTCRGSDGPLRLVLQAANPWALKTLRHVLGTFRPDVVHVRQIHTQLSPLVLSLLGGIPAILHVVNYFPICPVGTKLLPDRSPCRERAGRSCSRNGCMSALGMARMRAQRSAWRRWGGHIDWVVANSDWTRRRLLDDGFRCDESIWNGVPERPARPPLRDPPTISFTGRLYAKKGLDVLLDAMPLVLKEVPDARLLVAGEGPERRSVARQIERLGLQEIVTLVGHVQRGDLEERLADAWVQAVPSRWEEPFGLVTAEAMMRGTAVVASRTGGLTELVKEGETGFTVAPADDAVALSEALVRVLTNRELAEELGRRGRVRALDQLTEDRVVERFLRVYGQLVADRNRVASGMTPDA